MNKTNTLLYVSSFLLTCITTTLAGVQWLNKSPFELENLSAGLQYSGLLILVLLSHEMGHLIAARIHKIDTTYPLFLPFPSFLGILSFGTLGAVIRIKGHVHSRKALFDIGVAGPIVGFVTSLSVLIIGLLNLPAREYLFAIHPEYANLSTIPEGGLVFGNSLAYSIASKMFVSPNAFLPPMNEVYHYPFLCVGWFGLLVTAMNLIPIGQLDGGHISYCMFGTLYHAVAQICLVLLVVLGLSGLLPVIGVDFTFGWFGWFIWAIILVAFIKFAKANRPATDDETPLDSTRFTIGVCCWLILIVSFSPNPFPLVP